MAIRYYAAIVFLGLVPALYYLAGPVWPLLAVVLIPVMLVGGEFLLSHVAANDPASAPIAFRLLPLLYIPLQVVVIGWAAWIVSLPSTDWLTFISLVMSVGIMTGVFGMMAAHELIHSRDPVENAIGALMLTGMSYRHFRIAHVHGHHRYAATPRDPATAREGESFYAFVPRTLVGQFGDAWRHEEARRARLGRGLFGNRVVRDLVLTFILYVAVAATLGVRAVVFFAVESAVAILALELFNYVAHYGLMRRDDEPFCDGHAWNASNTVGNAVLFNMGRHSDHHRRAASPYQTLQPVAAAPELPAGYAGSMLLALIPPLWRKVMDRRIGQLRTEPAE